MPVRVIDIPQPIAGVDENQPGLSVDQQAMADEPAQRGLASAVEQGAAQGAVGAAFEVMDPDALSFQALGEGNAASAVR